MFVRASGGFVIIKKQPAKEDCLELIVGLEPTTCALRMRCSTN